MAQITPNMALVVWNNLSDPYNSSQLVDNFVKIDAHDHTGGTKGLQLDGALSIQANTITSAQLGTNSVTNNELSNSSTYDNNRAVTTDHIRDNAVTTDKIADNAITAAKIPDGSITRVKIDTTALATPTIVHSGNGSLPSLTVDSTSLYEGYLIDYTDNAAPASRNYLWRLRYNGINWDCIGGVARHQVSASVATAGGNGPTAGSMYTGWGGVTFQSFTLPLKGTYDVTASGSGQMQNGSYTGNFQAALFLGAGGSGTVVTELAGTSATAYCSGDDAGSGDQVTAAIVAARVNTSSNSSSGNILRQVFGCSYKSNANADFILNYQRLSVIPSKNLTNF
jgi:hypothetical protein